MRNLLLLLWRYNFFLFFLAIEGFCFYLVYQNSHFHHATLVNSTNTVAAKINSALSAVTEYVNLKETNDALARQNAALKSLLPGVYYIDSVNRQSVNDSLRHQQYRFMTARVVNNSTNRRSNYLTLDRGILQGVRPEMGVISAEGVVGIVKDVSDHYCSVLSFLHKDSRISARVKKNGFIGSMVWDGYDDRFGSLKDIAKHVKLAKGDTIVTSSYSKIFPEGVPIGVIDLVNAKTGDNFQEVKVRLSVSFGSLTHVYIVGNLMKEEQVKLEEGQKDDR
jgi:rod shape-determining protein MreC